MVDGGRGEDASATGSAFRVRLPGFVLHDDVGLGDVIKRVTTTFGVAPCQGCEKRAAALNRHVVITSVSRKRT